MADAPGAPPLLVLSRAWLDGGSEACFVTRSVAGASTRTATVQVVVPGPAGPPRPDGAFDLHFAGHGGTPPPWPAAGRWRWPGALAREGGDGEPDAPAPGAVVVERGDAGAAQLARAALPGVPLLELGRGALTPLELGLFVPVNPLASERPHTGLGFSGYVLVLTDRQGDVDPLGPPLDEVAWLTSVLPRHHVVVVEGGYAVAWRGRARRGAVHVDTRTDLWRLMAHAAAMVDLAPGDLVARECVEALRLGTPVLVPAAAAAAAPAAEAGGIRFRGVAELLDGAATLTTGDQGRRLGERGREWADHHHGDPGRFVDRVAGALGAVPAGSGRGARR